MKRGDLVTVVTSGDYGKPRPALIVQSDRHGEHPSITVLPLLAVEPNIANVRLIEASRRANAFDNVIIAACGAGAAPGILTLNTAFSNGMTGPVGNQLNDIMTAQIVPCLPLPALFPTNRRIDFIKIDVEGAEHVVLAAARDLIARWRPIIVSEFSPGLLQGNSGVSGAEYLEFFRSLGYQISIVDGGIDAAEASISQVIDAFEHSKGDHIDILLVPSSSSIKRDGELSSYL